MNSIYDEALAALHSIWQRRWLALAVAWSICLLGWLVVALVPNTYESKARIFVQLDDALAEQIGLGTNSRKRDIERVRQTLTSAVNLEKVVRSTRIGENINNPKDTEAAVLALAKRIQVVNAEDNLFEITAESGDGSFSDAENARLAQEIVQKMIDIFREENLAGGRGEMTETLEFMNQQLSDRQKDLEQAEQKRLAFQSQHPELAEGGSGMIQRLEAARTQLRDVEADLVAAQSSLAAINGQLAGMPPSIPGAPGQVGGSRASLAQAQAELAALRARGMTDNHPDVISLRNQVSALRQVAQGEPAGAGGVPNPAYTSLMAIKAERQANVQALQVRRSTLQADVANFSSLNIKDPDTAAEFQRITRDYDVLKQQYDKLLRDREELRLRGQVETERSAVKFQVIDPPTTPRKPVAPNRPMLLAAVLMMGIGGGVAVAFALGQLRNSFATTAKLEKAIGLPVLGAISMTLTERARERRRKLARYFVAATICLGAVFVLLLAVEFVQVRMVA
ncbi:MAG: XrtA system polysaccharide chain length determinant [Novosphingobium sp.]